MDVNEQSYFDANRELWNTRVAAHLQSEFYAVDKFRTGTTSLNPVEIEVVGDVRGKTLLHLQCHFGLDTLSWARLGADVTGTDISGEAIEAAEKLRDETKLSGKFVCCNLYDLPRHLRGSFDVVFTSYGTIGWLPDLERWARIVEHFLKPGGQFVIADFHPVVWMLDDNLSKIKYSYFNREVIVSDSTGSYATSREGDVRKEYGWNHSFGELIGALLKQGLRITHFEEYPFSPYNCFQELEQGEDGMWRASQYGDKIPMMYTLKAEKAAG